jgi:hypothetical protein
MQPKAENRIMIYGPKDDGTYWVEFKTDKGASLVISVPSGETAVLRHFQARMPYGLVVPEVKELSTCRSGLRILLPQPVVAQLPSQHSTRACVLYALVRHAPKPERTDP